MFLDANLMFCQGQELRGSTVSQKTLCLDNKVGSGLPMHPFFQVQEVLTGLTSLSIEVQSADVITDSVENIPESAFQTISESRSLTAEHLEKHPTIYLSALPPEAGRFLRLKFTVNGSVSAGKVNAGLVLDRQLQ